MKRKRATALLVNGMIGFALASLLGTTRPVRAAEDWDSERYGNVLDVGNHLESLAGDADFLEQARRKVESQAAEINFQMQAAAVSETASGDFTYDGGTKLFLDYNLTFKPFTLRSVGAHVEVWVAEDLSYPEGDPRQTPVVSQQQVDLLRDEFDQNIYPTATSFFGQPDRLDGTESVLEDFGVIPPDYYGGSDKVLLLVDNVQDQNYADPAYPNFVAGFYWQVLEQYTGRNIVTVDTFDWTNNLESVFFRTTIHELQHLIQADHDPAEETWLNEGLSTFAEYLGGYGHNYGAINYYLDHPENSLVNWDEHLQAPTGPETLADYGQAYLFTLYLYDRFGQDFIRQLAHNGNQGIASIEEVLAANGMSGGFLQVYQDFIAALVIDSSRHGSPQYAFTSINLREVPVDQDGTPRGYTVNFENAALFEKEGVPAWGGDFKKLDFSGRVDGISFTGADFLPGQEAGSGYVEYTATFINERLVGKGKGAKTNYKVVEVDPFNVTDQDALSLRQLFKDGNTYMIVSYAAPQGQTEPAVFNYEIKLK